MVIVSDFVFSNEAPPKIDVLEFEDVISAVGF